MRLTMCSQLSVIGFWLSALTATVCVSFAGLAQADEPPQQPASAPAQVDPAEVERLIGDLSDPSFEKRTEATRRLCAAGQAAVPALKRVAKGDDYESAIRARNLLRVLDQLFFTGLAIELAVSKDEIAWNQPVDLTVTLTNRSAYPSHVPFEASLQRRKALQPAVRAVADLIDLADFLTVSAPDGEEIELRVDDINANPFVAAIVQARTEGGPTATLEPGEKLVYRVAGFNRAWARYPLLERGAYRIRFAYEPEWDDPQLRDAQVGLVTTEPVAINVREPAPEIVREGRGVPRLSLTREADAIVATLTNTSDLALSVNTNFGSDEPPLANVVWAVLTGEDVIKLPGNVTPRAAEAFSRARLVELEPGQAMELDRVPLERLRSAQNVVGLEAGAEFTVRCVYVNRTDCTWQAVQNNLIGSDRAPEGLREPLPPRLFHIHASSPEMALQR